MEVRSVLRSLALLLAIPLGAATSANPDLPAVPGHAVVARAEGNALAIWDASVEVAAIVKAGTDPAAAKDRLERDAMIVAQAEASKVHPTTSLSIRVIYSKTGDVSPVYGSATFAGVERYATLTISAADLKSDREGWKETATGTAPIPAWVTFTVVGELPHA